MKPLSKTLTGEKVEIIEIRGGRGLVTKLLNMGFYPGVIVEVVSNCGYGPLIVAKGGIRLGLGFGMAQKVFVK
jgi:ferrous iron transport protein A